MGVGLVVVVGGVVVEHGRAGGRSAGVRIERVVWAAHVRVVGVCLFSCESRARPRVHARGRLLRAEAVGAGGCDAHARGHAEAAPGPRHGAVGGKGGVRNKS